MTQAKPINGTTTMMTISSQRHRDESIVIEKRAAKDYVVVVSPEFEFDGETMRVVIDGHHSLEAAKRDGVEPEWVTGNATEHHDAMDMIAEGRIEEFLEIVQGSDAWYDVEDGIDVW